MLEVGGGVGAIQLELLQAGAARTVNVELSPAYEPYAAELLRANGLDGRADRRVLDFAGGADELEPADVVVLHRRLRRKTFRVYLHPSAAILESRPHTASKPRLGNKARFGNSPASTARCAGR